MYKTVAERVQELHAAHKEVSIRTAIVPAESGTHIIRCEITIPGLGQFIGHAEERIGSTMINKTSALENCETSAVGRALAFAGFGGDEIASADEVAAAINQQNNMGRKPSPGVKPQSTPVGISKPKTTSSRGTSMNGVQKGVINGR